MSKENEGSKCVDSPWKDLVIAILAVNQYSLEKTYPLVGSLDKTGLFDPTSTTRALIVLRSKIACARADATEAVS